MDSSITDYGQPTPPADVGQTWSTEQLTEEFEVLGFSAPFVVVRRKSDGVKGSLEFTHMPRVYFNWSPAARCFCLTPTPGPYDS